jgi:hypothetical protein
MHGLGTQVLRYLQKITMVVSRRTSLIVTGLAEINVFLLQLENFPLFIDGRK